MEFLICKYDGTVTTKDAFKKKFEKNLLIKGGWAEAFESFEACVNAWFW